LLQRTFVTCLGLDPIREALILISIVEIQIPKNRNLTSWFSHSSGHERAYFAVMDNGASTPFGVLV
jgi:hypothetical protein